MIDTKKLFDFIKYKKDVTQRRQFVPEHADSDSLYGHCSYIVDLKNTKTYPDLLKAHPITFTINPGEAVIIPKNWWHAVETFEGTYGCNIWINAHLGSEPQKINHNIKFDFEDLKNERVQIMIKNDLNEYSSKFVTFEQFLTEKNTNEYMWSLDNYDCLKNNREVSKKIASIVEIPEIIKQTGKNFEFNAMVVSRYFETKLHYDDEDGLLCVVKGKKTITLFPPEDTPYLYPVIHKKYSWKESPAIDGCYNIFQHGKQITGISSAQLLFQTCEGKTNVLSTISNIIYKKFQINEHNKTVWGFKKNNESYTWELYDYNKFNPDTKCVVVSYEIYPERTGYGSYVSCYHDKYYLTEHRDPYSAGIIKRIDSNNNETERGIWILDTQENFKTNYNLYLKELKFSNCNISEDIITKYKSTYTCIHQKFNDEFYVQYIGISKEDFIDFLEQNAYDTNIINLVKRPDYNIPNEITIVYDMLTKQIKRSGFYGFV
jgi:hypothetical protein